jgi:hypothetical protein
VRRFDPEALVASYEQTASVLKTAEIMGCSSTTVHAAVKAAGKSRPRSGEPRGSGRPVGVPYSKVSSAGYVTWTLRHWVDGRRVYEYLPEHRIVMEMLIGRPLQANETVHHRNGARHDNRPENLELRFGPHGTGATHCPHCGLSLTER